MAQHFFVSRAWLHTSMYAPVALALESTHPSSLLLGLAYSFGRIGCPFFVFALGYVCPYTRPSRSSVAPACGRHRYHPAKGSGWLRSLTIANHYRPAKGSFARFPSGASLNATMQFTLLPSELEQNLSFSGADCDVRHSIVSGFLPLIDWERRSMQPCNSRSYPWNSDKISLSRAPTASLQAAGVARKNCFFKSKHIVYILSVI